MGAIGSYAANQPHAPSLIGDRAYSYDLNGNQTGWDNLNNGTQRLIVWDEENRIQSIADNGQTMSYVYDDAGERVIKTGPQGETAYINQFYVVRNREVATKHVFAGGSRLISQLAGQPDENGVITTPTAGNSGQVPWGWSNGNGNGGNGNGNHNAGGTTFEADQYFYHPDHLGSSSYVTDIDGEIFQHVEYFPFGETFFQESSNTQRTPYLFTGKELDEETGLYYFGARYYDPRTSVWQSADPILASYMGGKPNGGVFDPANLNLYGYVLQSPVRLVDPNGLSPFDGLNSYPYTALNGVQAHLLFSTHAVQYLGSTLENPNALATDKRLGSLWQVINGAIRPDVFVRDNARGGRVWELKPITHLSNSSYREADALQLGAYRHLAFQNGIDLRAGESSDLVPMEGYQIGSIVEAGGAGALVYDVKLYTGGTDGQKGLIYYSLTPNGQTKGDLWANALSAFGQDIANALQGSKPIFIPLPGKGMRFPMILE